MCKAHLSCTLIHDLKRGKGRAEENNKNMRKCVMIYDRVYSLLLAAGALDPVENDVA